MPVRVVTLPFQFLWCFSGQPHCEPWEIDSCSRSLGSVHFREFIFRERPWFHSFQPFAHSFEFAGRDYNEFSTACVQWLRVSLMVSKFSFPRSRHWVKDVSASSLIWRVMSEKIATRDEKMSQGEDIWCTMSYQARYHHGQLALRAKWETEWLPLNCFTWGWTHSSSHQLWWWYWGCEFLHTGCWHQTQIKQHPTGFREISQAMSCLKGGSRALSKAEDT